MNGMGSMRGARVLLEHLSRCFPPRGPARHNLTINEQGDLEVCLFLGDKSLPVVLEYDDLDRPLDDLLVEVVEIVSRSGLV